MKKGICLAFIVLTLVFAGVLPAYARDGHARGGGHEGHGGFVVRGGVWFGPPWWGPWWWPPYYPYYPYYPYPEPQEETPVYEEPPAQEEEYYWYYCPNPQGYYPYVKKCPGGWLQVVPSEPTE